MEGGGQRVQVAEEDRLPLPKVLPLPKGNFREPRRKGGVPESTTVVEDIQ